MSSILEMNDFLVLGYSLFPILIGLLFAEILKKKNETVKIILFLLIVIPAVLATFFLVASTIYKNNTSFTKGPVHYHADIEIWRCGTKLDIVNPKGWSNKVGTELLHEHNDERIHVEGAIKNPTDITLAQFFQVIGGSMTNASLRLPTDSKLEVMSNMEGCEDGEGVLQVFVYHPEGTKLIQEKLTDPKNFVLAPYSSVPPGNCIIVEFGAEKDKTDKMCTSYKVKVEKGELHGS